MLWALGFVSMFVIGGLSGIYLGSVPIDIHTSDTYFVVAHIHYVLLGGSLFTVFAGIYYWFPKMTGRMYNERLGKLHFWLTFVGFNVTFFPMHWHRACRGCPGAWPTTRRDSATWNFFISIASFFLGASFLIFVYNMIVPWKRGPMRRANPWRALTLEWQVSSPPPSSTSTRSAGRRRARTSTASGRTARGFNGDERALEAGDLKRSDTTCATSWS